MANEFQFRNIENISVGIIVLLHHRQSRRSLPLAFFYFTILFYFNDSSTLMISSFFFFFSIFTFFSVGRRGCVSVQSQRCAVVRASAYICVRIGIRAFFLSHDMKCLNAFALPYFDIYVIWSRFVICVCASFRWFVKRQRQLQQQQQQFKLNECANRYIFIYRNYHEYNFGLPTFFYISFTSCVQPFSFVCCFKLVNLMTMVMMMKNVSV